MSINKNLVFVILIISFILIFNLLRDVRRLIRAEERIVKVEERLEQVKEENEEFKGTKEYYQSNAFLEEQIRNKLQMARPGETILILPKKLSEVKEESSYSEASSFAKASEDKSEDKENWEKWLELFWR